MPVANPEKVKKRKNDIEMRMSSRLVGIDDDLNQRSVSEHEGSRARERDQRYSNKGRDIEEGLSSPKKPNGKSGSKKRESESRSLSPKRDSRHSRQMGISMPECPDLEEATSKSNLNFFSDAYLNDVPGSNSIGTKGQNSSNSKRASVEGSERSGRPGRSSLPKIQENGKSPRKSKTEMAPASPRSPKIMRSSKTLNQRENDLNQSYVFDPEEDARARAQEREQRYSNSGHNSDQGLNRSKHRKSKSGTKRDSESVSLSPKRDSRARQSVQLGNSMPAWLDLQDAGVSRSSIDMNGSAGSNSLESKGQNSSHSKRASVEGSERSGRSGMPRIQENGKIPQKSNMVTPPTSPRSPKQMLSPKTLNQRENDLNQSYVFDYDEDIRAREREQRYSNAGYGVEQGLNMSKHQKKPGLKKRESEPICRSPIRDLHSQHSRQLGNSLPTKLDMRDAESSRSKIGTSLVMDMNSSVGSTSLHSSSHSKRGSVDGSVRSIRSSSQMSQREGQILDREMALSASLHHQASSRSRSLSARRSRSRLSDLSRPQSLDRHSAYRTLQNPWLLSRESSIRRSITRTISRRLSKEPFGMSKKFGGSARERVGRDPSRRRESYTSATRRYLRENVHRPPKSILLVWFIVIGQLMLDLVTTIMSYIQLNQSTFCCDYKVNLGRLPRAVTDPYLVVILVELLFLIRSMSITLFPKSAEAEAASLNNKPKSCLKRMFAAFMKWNAKMLLEAVQLCILLNPFFGAAVTWILLYQTSQNWAFAALALQGTTQGELF